MSRNETFPLAESLQRTELYYAYAQNALRKELDYLLRIDADKLLFYFYRNAGLKPRAACPYGGGWEGKLIGGHTAGHYLSALAQALRNANTPESEKKALSEKIGYFVNCLKICQDNAEAAGSGKGFLWGALPISDNREIQFDHVEQDKTDIRTQAWVPWYTLHKILQGLVDAWVCAENERAKEVACALGDWVCKRVARWTEEVRRIVLATEYGGMNDVLYRLYALTGEEKYAAAAHAFDEEPLLQAMIEGKKDYLDGVHANTTIPKAIGFLNRYLVCNGERIGGEVVRAEKYLEAAKNFWDCVVLHHTYATGGNSEWEHFGKDGILNGERTNANCETCNTYNLLKLSRMLFLLTRERKYLDYYENTWYNAILSSQNPETGMTTYFQPMATGYFKVFSSAERNFWCCTGSGMESMTKLNDGIYYDVGDAVYVASYLPSRYRSERVTLLTEADLEHSDTATVRVERGEAELCLRVPDWTETFEAELNGKPLQADGDFLSVGVKAGDTVRIALKKTVRAHDLPDGKNTYAFRFGPFLLSADLGCEDMEVTTTGVNVTVPAFAKGEGVYSLPTEDLCHFMREIDARMRREEDGTFTLACKNGTLRYAYHFRRYKERYGIYFEFIAGGENEEYISARQSEL